jgi:4a-hydroxytetrahydrobiopterin dehydratase
MSSWKDRNNKLQKEYEFTGFKQAIEFVNKVAEVAEAQNHHPEICINYNKVLIKLQTHETGGVTDKDFKLARAIDKLE